jgi:hypothetical protein
MSADALHAVAAQIARGWSQGADARDADGRAVPLSSDAARAWSPLGAFALLATDGIRTDHVRRALVAFADVIGADSLQAWNDAPGRSREEVLSALEEAIEQIEDAQ